MTTVIWLFAIVLGLLQSRPTKPCVDKTIVDLLKHDIAYSRHLGGGPFKGVGVARTIVWARGGVTAFYFLDQVPTFEPTLRLVYWYRDGQLVNRATCSSDSTWQSCIETSPTLRGANTVTGTTDTCPMDINVTGIPPWTPSPDDAIKRRLGNEVKTEIEQAWGVRSEIVVRDFNLLDPEILIYMRDENGEEGYTRCWFRWHKTPHCEGWLGFGQATKEDLKPQVFEHPYKLK